MSSNISDTLENNIAICKTIKNVNKNIKTNIVMSVIKRIFDIFIGLIGAIILLPMSIIIAIAKIIAKDGTPLFYKQKRVGKNGKFFYIYKFRTMVENADELLCSYLNNNKDIEEEFKKYRKIKNDPRVTKIGKFLRDTSIDEFPQFINVLNGTMSFIGPRPIVEDELKLYGEAKDVLLSVKPGITGFWQVNGGNKVTYDERIKQELYYIENKSLWLDIKIFFKTFKTVF